MNASGDVAEVEKPKHLYLIMVLGLLLIIIFTGIRKADGEFYEYFRNITHGIITPIPSHKGFLFEGVLPDILMLLANRIEFPQSFLPYMWGLFGVVGLVLLFIMIVRRKDATVSAIVVALCFTRMPDALLMWVGKPDPLLMAALILSITRGKLSLLGFALAPFIHPLLSLISATGVLSVRYVERERRLWIPALITLLCCVLDLMIFRIMFQGVQDRTTYLLSSLKLVVADGAQWGFPSLFSGIVLPCLSIVAMTSVRSVISYSSWITYLRWMPLAIYLVASGLVTSFLVLDHTRDAGLVTFAPALAYLGLQRLGEHRDLMRCGNIAVLALFLGRLAAPHYDAYGPETFRWSPVRQWAAAFASLSTPIPECISPSDRTALTPSINANDQK